MLIKISKKIINNETYSNYIKNIDLTYLYTEINSILFIIIIFILIFTLILITKITYIEKNITKKKIKKQIC